MKDQTLAQLLAMQDDIRDVEAWGQIVACLSDAPQVPTSRAFARIGAAIEQCGARLHEGLKGAFEEMGRREGSR